jgi:hypothetical protein
MTAIPYNLKPKKTRLPAGHDITLDPAVPPTNPLLRALAANTWPKADTSLGSTGPPDVIARTSVDPAVRGIPPFAWPKGAVVTPNRSVAERVFVGDLDPDIAMWRSVIVSIWPFGGPPAEGIWPKGWMGIDDTATIYVCTVAGEPGTWEAVGATAGVASFNTRIGVVVLEAADVYGVLSAPVAGVLATLYPCTGSFATFLTTASLAVGIWQIDFTGMVDISPGTTTSWADIIIAEGTAVATFNGPTATGAYTSLSAGNITNDSPAVKISCQAVVTVAGTLIFRATGITADILASTLGGNTPGATGYTATRIG